MIGDRTSEIANLIDPSVGMACPRCGGKRATTSHQRFVDGTTHIRADCAMCGAFIRYLPKKQGAVSLPLAGPQRKQPATPIWPDVPVCASCGKRWAVDTGLKLRNVAIALCLKCAADELPRVIGAAVARATQTWNPDEAKRWAKQLWRGATLAYEQALGGVA